MDENDTPPSFHSDGSVDIKLSEAFLAGHTVGTVPADDPDSNARSGGFGLTYSLGLETQAFLSVDPGTGVLTLNQPIDREEHAEVEMEVMVSDGVHSDVWKKVLQVPKRHFSQFDCHQCRQKKPVMFENAIPVLNVIGFANQVEDINDNAPVFDSPHFSFDVLESSGRGAVVGRIHAADADAEGTAFSRVSYRLISEYGSDTFDIDPDLGVITLAGHAGDSVRIDFLEALKQALSTIEHKCL